MFSFRVDVAALLGLGFGVVGGFFDHLIPKFIWGYNLQIMEEAVRLMQLG